MINTCITPSRIFTAVAAVMFHVARVLANEIDLDTSDVLSAAESGTTAAATNTLPSDIYSQVDGGGHDASIQTQTALPPPPLTISECLLTFTAINFETDNFDRYSDYFHDDSVLTLAQAGRYKGAADIEEYVRFASDSSPFILKVDTVGGKFMVHSFDPEARTCSYLVYKTNLYEMDSATAQKSSFLLDVLYKLTYSYNEGYFLSVSVFLTPEYFEFLFGRITNTDKTRNKICEISEGCKGVNVGLTREECVSKMKELPTTTNGVNIDGKSQGCRVLHSVFAETNEKHCPHLSFEPLEDSKGKVKCQTSENIQVSDHFDDLILKDFNDWMDSSLTKSTDGYKILALSAEKTTTFWVLVGFVAPACVGMLTFGVLYFMEKKKIIKPEEDNAHAKTSSIATLMANKARPLFTLIVLMISTLAIVFGISGAINWGVALNHPDWKYTERSNPMQESYLEGVGKSIAIGTSPQTLLTDVQFQVYVGFVIWTTVVAAGLGLEIFVWHHFLEGNVWDATRDGMWKFAQFLFPLLAMTTFGLAANHNYWALPILVPALWKFGFPETLMHLYLGVFNKRAPWTDRACELCNGFGTLLHHGAASFIISMLVVGVFPPSRYLFNPIIILVMQHWVALLKYASLPLYSAIELILEYYFEWIILSDWPQLYHLHWTAALGASVMLIAHWLYLAAAGFSMLIPGLEEKVGGETFGKALMATSSKQPSILVDEEGSKEEEQLDGIGCVQTKPQDTIRRRSTRRSTMLAFTTAVGEIDEEEGTAGGMASRGGRMSLDGRACRTSMLGRDTIDAQYLVLSLAREKEN